MKYLNFDFQRKRKRRGVKYDLMPYRSRKSVEAIQAAAASVGDAAVELPPTDGADNADMNPMLRR